MSYEDEVHDFLSGLSAPVAKPLSMQLLDRAQSTPPPPVCEPFPDTHIAAPPFRSGFGPAQPAAATPSGLGGTATKAARGVDSAEESRVMALLLACPANEARNSLARDWSDLNARIREYLAGVHELRIEGLRAELEVVLLDGRTALDKVKEWNIAVRAAQARLSGHLDPLSKARLELKVAQNEKPNADTWPTAEELAAYEERLKKAQEKAAQAEQLHTYLGSEVSSATYHADEARRVLQALRKRREDLQAQIAGKPVVGPFGLQRPTAG